MRMRAKIRKVGVDNLAPDDKIEEEAVITQSNSLITASYKLTLDEQRAVLCCIAKLNPNEDMPEGGRVRVYVEEYAEAFNLPLENAFRQLKSAANNLFERAIDSIYNGERLVRIRWVRKVDMPKKFTMKDGFVDFYFSEEIAPHLTFLNDEKSSFQLRMARKLSSSYAIRMLSLLMSHGRPGKLFVGVTEFKTWLKVNEQYPRFFDLKKRVIEPACKEISEKTSLNVKWAVAKEGRTVTGIWFDVAGHDGQLILELDG